MLALVMTALLVTSAASGKDVDDESAQFLDQCRYIITKLEAQMFKAQKTPEERHRFIVNFWKGLDPNPLTEVNEFRDTYYVRLDEANQLFTRGKKGYLSDRGKVYILLGPPDDKQSNPMGRTADEHGSEIWTYRSQKHKGLERDTSLVFIDSSGTGDFRLASNADLEAGAARAAAVRSLSTDLLALNTTVKAQANPREGNLLLDATKSAEAPPSPAPTTGEPAASVPFPGTIQTRYDLFRAQDDKTLLVITVGIDKATASGGTSGYKVFAKVEPKIPDPLIPTQDLMEKFVARDAPGELLYQAMVPLKPAEYKVVYGAMDLASGASKSVDDALTVPAFDDSALRITNLVPATTVEKSQIAAPAADGSTPAATLTPFELSGYTVVPCPSGKLTKQDELSVYFQIYGAKTDASGKSRISTHYLIHRKQPDGKWKAVGQSDPNEPDKDQMVQVYALPLKQLRQGAGDYKVEVTVTDKVGSQSVKGSALFSVK